MAIRDRIGFNWLTMGLLAIVFAEVLVLVTGNAGVGDIFTSTWFMAARIYGFVGPVLPPMALLVLLHLYVTSRLIRICRGNSRTVPLRLYRAFKVIEAIAPALGFVGTTLGLVKVMGNINPGLSQSEMLKALMNHSASAFGSTIFGLVLSIATYLTRELFENFLLYRHKSKEALEPIKQVVEDRKKEACI